MSQESARDEIDTVLRWRERNDRHGRDRTGMVRCIGDVGESRAVATGAVMRRCRHGAMAMVVRSISDGIDRKNQQHSGECDSQPRRMFSDQLENAHGITSQQWSQATAANCGCKASERAHDAWYTGQ